MSRVDLVALVFVAAMLSGCTDEGAGEVPAAGSDDPVLVTDADDYSYLENESLGNRSHLHDYWHGAESLVVLEQTVPMSGLVMESRKVMGTLRPDEGQTVLLGTSHVEVTVDWVDYNTPWYGPVELWVKTAHMDVAAPVAEVTSGDTVTVPSTNDDNDLPHQTLSGWAFALVTDPPVAPTGTGPMHYTMEVTMTVTAYRGLEIPLFPGHPDHWGAADRLVLEESGEDALVMRGGDGGSEACLDTDGCPDVVSPENGSIVPPGTGVVEFVVTYDAGTTQRLAWDFHGADTWHWARLSAVEDDGTTYTYSIAVEEGMADGPYADQSLWEFRPSTPGGFDGADAEAPADGAFTGGYSVALAAVKEDPAA